MDTIESPELLDMKLTVRVPELCSVSQAAVQAVSKARVTMDNSDAEVAPSRIACDVYGGSGGEVGQ